MRVLNMTKKRNLDVAKEFWSWCNQTAMAHVYEFTADGNDILSLLNFDTSDHNGTGMRSVMSDYIDEYQKIDPEQIEWFRNTTENTWVPEDGDTYLCYRLYKMLWLANDIAEKGQKAPIQLLQSGREYQCHPGSDKKFVITYLQQLDKIHGFYIWYPMLDNSPWIWTVPNREIQTAEEFLGIFQHADHPTFVLEANDVTFTKDGFQCDNEHMTPFAEGTLLGLKKYGNLKDELNLTVKHLSYRDGVHRKNMDMDKTLLDQIYFSDEDTFRMGRFTFIRRHDGWWPVHLLNSPRSLIDAKWKNDDKKSTFFNRKRSNLGIGRHYL